MEAEPNAKPPGAASPTAKTFRFFPVAATPSGELLRKLYPRMTW